MRKTGLRLVLHGEWCNFEPRRTVNIELFGIPMFWIWFGHRAWEVGVLGIGARLYL